MKRMQSLLLAAVVLAVVPVAAQAQQFFDFNGQARVPAQVGGTLTMYSIVTNNNQVPTPIPLDFANFQYTLVVTNLTWVAGSPTQQYLNGAIVLYEDNATPADYSNPATFTDGTQILIGVLRTLNRTLVLPTLGTANGLTDWTGGTQIALISPSDRLGWAFVTGISRRPEFVVAGYDENWDGKVEPQSPIIPNELKSWGRVKGDYQP
jgi:hypothetical protein